jgi:hypothetical protein
MVPQLTNGALTSLGSGAPFAKERDREYPTDGLPADGAGGRWTGDRTTDLLKRGRSCCARSQFFEIDFDSTKPRPKFGHLVVQKERAFRSLQLRPLKHLTILPSPIPSPISLRVSSQGRFRLPFSSEIPWGNLELACQPQCCLQLQALDVAVAHFARGVSGNPENVAEFGVA